jgi:hypothetical protein
VHALKLLFNFREVATFCNSSKRFELYVKLYFNFNFCKFTQLLSLKGVVYPIPTYWPPAKIAVATLGFALRSAASWSGQRRGRRTGRRISIFLRSSSTTPRSGQRLRTADWWRSGPSPGIPSTSGVQETQGRIVIVVEKH